MTRHLFTDYFISDGNAARRNRIARSTWPVQGWEEVPIRDDQLPRLWEEDGKALPYIKDVFDLGMTSHGDDILIYTNADICLSIDCRAKVEKHLEKADACYAYRRDFQRIDVPIPDDGIRSGQDYAGSDLCGFKVRWWIQHRDEMPDMILGLEAWDPCYRTLVDVTNPGKPVSVRDVIYHERHSSFWEQPMNRYRLDGQKYCLRLACEFLKAHGVNPAAHCIPEMK